ncbi:MAG TPA: hypothetical protein PLE74_03945 [Candidatus Cloacimonadota bacterium]|nr:hypothetical protein [Candidatus Cloacimonadota bacterium]HPT71412.1 hypothetical protein [Candidatus Cloacimonadota bacterium]
MKTWKLFILLLVLSSFILMLGCAGKAISNIKDASKIYSPDWWRTQTNAAYIYTYGMATDDSISSSRSAAYKDAISQAVQNVEPVVQAMVNRYIQESGIQDPSVLSLVGKIIKTTANRNYSNALITKQETIITDDNRYKTMLQVGIPENAVEKELLNNIMNEETLYKQFKKSKAFLELESQNR